jgi:hypothetical protein
MVFRKKKVPEPFDGQMPQKGVGMPLYDSKLRRRVHSPRGKI